MCEAAANAGTPRDRPWYRYRQFTIYEGVARRCCERELEQGASASERKVQEGVHHGIAACSLSAQPLRSRSSPSPQQPAVRQPCPNLQSTNQASHFAPSTLMSVPWSVRLYDGSVSGRRGELR
jgi:hypothetical protein